VQSRIYLLPQMLPSCRRAGVCIIYETCRCNEYVRANVKGEEILHSSTNAAEFDKLRRGNEFRFVDRIHALIAEALCAM
jgi:hypothetical protein